MKSKYKVGDKVLVDFSIGMFFDSGNVGKAVVPILKIESDFNGGVGVKYTIRHPKDYTQECFDEHLTKATKVMELLYG